ncbi:GtrA family protein [Achromobacter deleyi]|uniref:GtrA family protein n=1 Tax=Achromobacter deleyi TaxID=1353891 RepID=UPI001491BEA0|nr:GtrA family protein [Achromobacter deleyi]QVQ24818.1 GtrA family protein [Achromobacter deleyi]UIP20358.1 GtrA family protein [Achromobacter deleyi]
MRTLLQQISLFVAVGCAASVTHWAVAVGCVEAFGTAPLAANLVGWLAAFVVSFSGHYRLTFRHSPIPWTIAIRRFFLISATGFAINESAYAGLLHATDIPYDTLLALILIALAFATFIASRLWAFRHKPAA